MSFTAPTRQRVQPVVPLASMVDILFLLLIFFLTTSVFRDQEQQLDVTLPATEAASTPARQRTQITISVTRDDRVFLGDQPHTLDSLRATLAQLHRQFPNESVLIRGDAGSSLGISVQVMGIAYDVGMTNVRLGTVRPPTR